MNRIDAGEPRVAREFHERETLPAPANDAEPALDVVLAGSAQQVLALEFEEVAALIERSTMLDYDRVVITSAMDRLEATAMCLARALDDEAGTP